MFASSSLSSVSNGALGAGACTIGTEATGALGAGAGVEALEVFIVCLAKSPEDMPTSPTEQPHSQWSDPGPLFPQKYREIQQSYRQSLMELHRQRKEDHC